MAPREKSNSVKGEFRGSKAKTNFPLVSETINNNNQSPSQSSTVESSSREGFFPAPIAAPSPLDLDLLHRGGVAVRFPFNHQQAAAVVGVLPTAHPVFFFDAMFRSEKMNHHNRLSFDPSTVDFHAGGVHSDSDSSSVVDCDYRPRRKVLDFDLNLAPPPEVA
ncbi:hypothetical protein HHK36_001833 [Tetracentron sinense]|uniref:Uncharacterized protein n=1 Tax=Tetracentron sinense TaxID=13715 RepID=A0A835DV22_TETSI|nr:hypothetical protein HHK36_001833 [Tetracentron sinense]